MGINYGKDRQNATDEKRYPHTNDMERKTRHAHIDEYVKEHQ
jgi:hypothetical protein